MFINNKSYLSLIKHQKVVYKIKNYKTFGSIPPYFDYINKDGYFISDGWGNNYSSIHFRKISTEGKEIAKFRTFNPVRCLYLFPEGDKVIIATDNKYFLLNSKDLSLIEKYTKRVPKHPFCIAVFGEKIYSCTSNNVIYVYNTITATVRRLKIPHTKSTKEIFLNGLPHDTSKIRSKTTNPSFTLKNNLLLITTEHPHFKIVLDVRTDVFEENQ